jgi:5-methylcytosine-specific restriction endonuclease McrA
MKLVDRVDTALLDVRRSELLGISPSVWADRVLVKVQEMAARKVLNQQRRLESKKRYAGIARRRVQRELEAEGSFTPTQFEIVLERLGRRCLRCGSVDRLVADHVVPLCRGGKHDISNIQPLCSKCNLWKGIRIVNFRPES